MLKIIKNIYPVILALVVCACVHDDIIDAWNVAIAIKWSAIKLVFVKAALCREPVEVGIAVVTTCRSSLTMMIAEQSETGTYKH